MSQTIITAGDASAGLIQSAGNDGTLVLQTGAAGSKVNAITIAADGTPTLLKPPKLDATALPSMVRVNTSNGYGSTNTVIRRFTNVVTNQGSDITYADSATLGASFTINTPGVYAISYSNQIGVASNFGVSLNTTQPSTAFGSLTNVSERLALSDVYAANGTETCSVTVYLPAGSVIRPHDGSTTANSNPNVVQMTVTKVG